MISNPVLRPLHVALVCLALTSTLGCRYASRPKDGFQGCAEGPGKQCPDGYYCAIDKHCWSTGHSPSDASIDASIDHSDSGGASSADSDTVDRPATGRDGPSEAGVEVAADRGPSTCPSGQHNCGTCVDDNSPLHCGTQCQPCTAPAGGTPVCTATNVCDFTCGTLKKCSDGCVSGCCEDKDCPAQSDGKVGTCDTATHACNYACAADQKSCSGKCIPKTACCTRADCPSACQTCSASGTCDKVVNADDTNKVLCPGTCDAAGTCKSKRGQTCTTVAAGCVAGSVCSPDGICCDRACTGACEACDVAGLLGTCMPHSATPHIGHPTCSGTAAECAGVCTGGSTGQCSWTTTTCGATSCTSQTNAQVQVIGTSFVGRGTCSSGTCIAPAASPCAGALICASSSACKTTCGSDSDCIPGNYCSGATCTPKKSTGTACTVGGECISGACVDSVCCESSCVGLCFACSAAKTGATNGLCRTVRSGTDPDDDCAIESSSPCGRDGTCDGAGACRLQPATMACGTPTCTGATLSEGRCNGIGACVVNAVSQPCPRNLRCASATACATTCTARSPDDCASGFECPDGTSCVPATVPCGAVSCPVANGGGQCCVTSAAGSVTNDVFTCQGPGSTCLTSDITCDSKMECPNGGICCAFGNGCANPGHWTVHCVPAGSTCTGGPMSFGFQVCDPNLTSPSECQTGACQRSCVPGIYGCF